LINRHTLKELDLDTILRNPQLRAFHPGQLYLIPHFRFATLQAMIYFLTPVCSFDPHAAVGNAICLKGIGMLLSKKSRQAVLACRLTCTASHILLSAPVLRFPNPLLVQSLHTLHLA
jgi:hypothetical protein